MCSIHRLVPKFPARSGCIVPEWFCNIFRCNHHHRTNFLWILHREVRLTIIISTTTIPKYFSIFVLISVNFKICFSYVTKISGGNDTINGIFLFVKESFPICNRKIPMVRRGIRSVLFLLLLNCKLQKEAVHW